MNTSNDTAITGDAAAIPVLQGQLRKVVDLLHEYEELARDDTNRIDLSARVSRIGGRLQALTALEEQHLLPLLDHSDARHSAQGQVDVLQGHVRRLAARSLDAAQTTGEMKALERALLAHVQWLDSEVVPRLHERDLPAFAQALAACQAQWRQNEAAD